ncbi:MAG: hypothetical protein QM768_13555 [Agriterribacter sp.]
MKTKLEWITVPVLVAVAGISLSSFTGATESKLKPYVSPCCIGSYVIVCTEGDIDCTPGTCPCH